jgi:transaldolase
MSGDMTGSVLLEGVRRTGTEFWNDACGLADLAYALENGATGATSNPPIVLGVVRSEGPTWRTRARELAAANPAWAEVETAWALIEEIVARGAGILEPVHRATGGAQGRISAQVSPTLARNAEAMVEQAVRLSSLAPNVQVKLPVTAAGIVAIEEAVARGIEINATLNFTVAGAIAVAEAVERGLDRRAEAGATGDLHPVCTLMVGRTDDWVKAACDRDDILLTPGTAEWAGIAVFKRAYRIYRERGYRTRLLAGAFRHHLPWTQLLGGDIVITIPPAWQRSLNASGLPVEPRIDEDVAPQIIDELLERAPEFRPAYEPDGLTVPQLDLYGATRRTLRQFLGAYADLQAEVRDVLVPNPDQRAARP